MNNTRTLEVARRAPNGQFQKIKGPPYQLTDQKLVRIGSAPQPKVNVQIEGNAKEIEPLHLLLRAANPSDSSTPQSAGGESPAYVLLNVSSQPITLYHPTDTKTPAFQKYIGPNDGPTPLFDYDYVLFGNNNFLLTYQTCEWLNIDVNMPLKKLRSGQKANAKVLFQRCGETPNIKPEDVFDFKAEIRDLDSTYARWQPWDRYGNEKFSGLYGGRVDFQVECIAECPAPGLKQRFHFVITLLQNGNTVHSVARGAEIEFAPCGPFALEFEPPNGAKR